MKLILDFNKGEFHSKIDMELPEQGVTAIFGPSVVVKRLYYEWLLV